MDKARNDLSAAVPKFCLALEEHRRTPDGRVRTSQELLASFFLHDDKTCTDRIFKYLPNEVRGPIVAAWGIRGVKAALRDSDEKVQNVVHDALVAGDIDHTAFEDGLAPETLVRWVPLGDLWSFWRGGKLTKQAIHKSLSTAYELYLFDARWFLDTIVAKGGALKGTDVLADGLTKDDLTAWMRRIHETGDGSPKGIVAALGWDKIVAKTPNDVLIAVLDAMVTKVGLVAAPPKDSGPKIDAPKPSEAPGATATVSATADTKSETIPPPAADGGEKKEGAPALVVEPSDKPPIDDGAWSTPPVGAGATPSTETNEDTGPQPAISLTSNEDAINVVVEDELIISDRSPPTAPRIPVAARVEEETPPPKAPIRSERPVRPGGSPFRRN